MTTVYAVCVPRLGLLHRTEEHLVEAKGVGAKLLDYHVGVHYVKHRLGHLLDSPAADVLTLIVKDKLSVIVLRSPSLECLNVEYVG